MHKHIHKFHRISYIFIFIIHCSLTSCNYRKSQILKESSFEKVLQIAKLKDKPFCIVLTDSAQRLSSEYLESLKHDYEYLTKKAVFNIVDISSKESEWYLKTLNPVSFPLTCIFSKEGQLIDLIPGAAKESFLYTDQALTHKEITEYHWPNRFNRNKESVVPFLAQAINFANQINKGIYNWKNYASLSDSLHEPYINYLLLRAAFLSKDSTFAIISAQRLVAMESSITLEQYKNEFIEAKKVLNPNFDIAKMPGIRTNKEKIRLSGLKVGQSVPVDIILFNDGEDLLKIEKINMSCTCVHLKGPDEQIIIQGKKSYIARFYFTPEDKGEVSRDIFIASNAFNQPNLHINILANVN